MTIIINDIAAVEYAFLWIEYRPTNKFPVNQTTHEDVSSFALR